MRRGLVVFAVLTLFLVPLCPPSMIVSNTGDEATTPSSLQGLFAGFEANTASDVWNQTPWVDVAVPGEFDLLTVLDYSDVGVLINNNSEASRTIGWAFVSARNISEDRVFIFNGSDVPTSETINRQAFQTHFEDPFRTMLLERNTSSSLNYLVTTKGIPLRVSGGNHKASFDQELSLVGGTYNSSIGQDWWDTHSYGPLAGGPMERFSRDEQGFFLVTRLTGYSVETALGLIEKANGSLGERGTHVLDLATNRNGSGYKFWNDDLYVANATLNQSHGIDVLFDETSTFLTNVSNVMGYASWGSNDGSWSQNFLPNQGFETADAATTSGRKFWEASAGSPAAGETFAWTWSDVKRGGSGAMALEVAANCSQFSGDATPGLHGEFFDNEGGVTIPSGAMPVLIDREPDHARVEADLDYGSSGQPYPGLDDRFKHNWGARFSGLVDVPWADNWTFHLTSDDGTELWIDGQSVVTNHGMHGMVERTGWVDLDAGLHDVRVEFYQGGGPHGLKLAWSTSNLSKTPIPASAFVVDDAWMPSGASLEHHWSFEDGSGSTVSDSVGDADLTATGMDASNWRSCVDGGCLWFDGVDDYLDVDVEDWDGNFTVSQWVWANSTSLPNYATVFAVSDNAGANASFQHAAFSGEWRLHNNQTHTFGAIEAQRWMHLVTVFDDGEVRQYFDGVLVNTHQQPAGAVNEIERYRMGVNRAGSTYFEGMIDEVAVWSSALEDWEITALNRAVLGTCQPLSVAGAQAANLSQTFDVPEELGDHAWLVLAHGRRSGTAHGSFHVTVEGLDAQGAVVSTNASSPRTTTTSWESDVTRFRPDVRAVQLRVTVTLDVVSTSVDGALHVDDVLLRAIRPSHDWVNGSIAETAVSTGGRSFTWGTGYGQSLVADLLEDGVSSVKGYVYEPYLTAVGSPSVLLDAYATGYSMAEAHAMANTQIGWMGVVVGDPKMAPYADLFHDVRLVDVRTVANVTQGLNATLELLVENHGMSAAEGRIEIRDVQGSTLLANVNLTLPAGNMSGSRVLMPLNFSVDRSGWIDVQVRYVANDVHAEVATDDNLLLHRFWSNAPPEVLDVRCLGQSAYRGDSIICEVEAVDDLNVTDVLLRWSLRNDTTNTTSPWEDIVLGTSNDRVWWSSLLLPIDAAVYPVGWLDLRAVVKDASAATTVVEVQGAMEVLNAPSTWFGPHVAGVDATPWSGISLPAGVPLTGLPRDATSEVTACVSDLDHDRVLEAPSLSVERKDGTALLLDVDLLGEVAVNPSLVCTAWNLTLPNGLPLEDVDLIVTVAEEERLRRRFSIGDAAPTVTLALLDEQGSPLDRAIGDGSERLHITYVDADDAGTGAVGDLVVSWPGQAARVLPVQIEAGVQHAVVALEVPTNPLEEGTLSLDVTLTGAHGAPASVILEREVVLTPPVIDMAVLCDERGEAEELRFGMEVWFGARVISTRPLQETVVTIEQEGWRSTAPMWEEGDTDASPSAACAAQVPDDEHARWFRLRPDSAFVNGEASVGLRATDIDGASSRALLDLILRHAPPVISNVTVNSTGTAGDPVTLSAALTDLDGVLGVACRLTVRDEGGNVVHDESVRVVAYTEEEATMSATWLSLGSTNGTLVQTLRCIDVDDEMDEVEVAVNLSAVNRTQADDETGGQKEAEADGLPTWAFLAPFLVAVLLVTTFALRSKADTEEQTAELRLNQIDEASLWDEEIVEVPSELKRPDGWTAEQYATWLNGP
ncbi:MAG: TIGR03790 family protein, partial [Candidatus Poseidoniaceae archaeon]